jgi:hypothetical protein
MADILVLYYSRGGSVAQLAKHVARGIGEVAGMRDCVLYSFWTGHHHWVKCFYSIFSACSYKNKHTVHKPPEKFLWRSDYIAECNSFA